MNTPTIETERLILRKFTDKDLEAIYLIFSDKEVNTFLPWFPLKTIEEAADFYKDNYLKKYKDEVGYHYAVCLKEDNYPIGYINVSGDDSHDFGYGLRREFWKQGIISEACRAVIKQVKNDNVSYITATHDICNPRSGYVMQSLGMEYKYSYKEQWLPKDKLVTFRMYQLNFDNNDKTYKKYWDIYEEHFIEKDI